VLSIAPNTFIQSISKTYHCATQCVLWDVGDVFFNLSLELKVISWPSLRSLDVPIERSRILRGLEIVEA
ncbi:hypothetical protein J6590_097045, partial [Homalodisca vitripennis]